MFFSLFVTDVMVMVLEMVTDDKSMKKLWDDVLRLNETVLLPNVVPIYVIHLEWSADPC